MRDIRETLFPILPNIRKIFHWLTLEALLEVGQW